MRHTIAKTKIEWASHVWNPVWGCSMGCSYCYARQIARRFAGNIARKEAEYNGRNYAELYRNLREFRPTLLHYAIDAKFPNEPAIIFTGSMSDIADWSHSLLYNIFRRMREAPEHQFLVLTKRPEKVHELLRGQKIPPNFWLGISVETQQAWCIRYPQLISIAHDYGLRNLFMSMEPLMSLIYPEPYAEQYIRWIMLGVMTGRPVNHPKQQNDILFYTAENFSAIPLFWKKIYDPLGVPITAEPEAQDFPPELRTIARARKLGMYRRAVPIQ